MKKTGVFYGSTTGTTESVARTIAEKLGIPSSDVYNADTYKHLTITTKKKVYNSEVSI